MMMMVVTKKILAREMKEGLSSGLWEPDEIELDVNWYLGLLQVVLSVRMFRGPLVCIVI